MAYVSPHREAHASFPQPDDGSVKVRRYLDLPRFISMLSSEALAFARVDSLEDRVEGSVPPAVYEEWKGRHADLGATARQGLRQQAFVSCWHANDAESEAMWRL